MAIKYSGIGHSAFRFNDFDRAVKFYRDILEFEEMYSANNELGEMHFAMLRIAKNQYMEVFAENYTPHGLEHSHNHMCYIVDDITAVARQLKAKGLKLFRG